MAHDNIVIRFCIPAIYRKTNVINQFSATIVGNKLWFATYKAVGCK